MSYRITVQTVVGLVALLIIPVTHALDVVPAAKSAWVYYWPYDVGLGIPDTGCDLTDIAAAQAAISAEDVKSTNICNAQFSAWQTAWPNLEGRTGGPQVCVLLPASRLHGATSTWKSAATSMTTTTVVRADNSIAAPARGG